MASRGVNKVIIIGNLGADPEVRYMPNSDAVANLTVATSESWTDKTTQEKREQTEWHRLVIYRRLAEIAGEYLRKGSRIYIEGKLRTRKWQDQNGVERYTTEIIVEELQMLDGNPNSGSNQGGAQQGGYNNNNNNSNNNNRAQGQPNRQRGGQQNGNRPQGGPAAGSPQGGFQQQGNFNHPEDQGGFNQSPAGPGAARGPMEPPIDFDDDIPF